MRPPSGARRRVLAGHGDARCRGKYCREKEVPMDRDIALRVRRFVSEDLLFGDAVADDAALLEAGLVSSTAILELVCFVEIGFGIEVREADLVRDNFDSIRSITAYVARRLREAHAAATQADALACTAMRSPS
jgi:acyl carrier protein